MMTRKTYVAIAEAVKDTASYSVSEHADSTIELLVDKLCGVFKADNSQFNETRFREACKPLK